MAVEYTLKLANTSVNKQLIDKVLGEMNIRYFEFEKLRSGFRIDEFVATTGFSLAFTTSQNNPFGYEDDWLNEPFQYKDNITFRIGGSLEWPQDIENVLKFCLLLLGRISDDALLTINSDTIYLLRLSGQYQVNLEGGIWQTPTGETFLFQTPHSTLN